MLLWRIAVKMKLFRKNIRYIHILLVISQKNWQKGYLLMMDKNNRIMI